MNIRKKIYRTIGASLVAACILAACNTAAPTSAPASVTATQAPASNSLAATATFQAPPTMTNTTVPAPTAAPTATTAPAATAAAAANTQLAAQVIPGTNAYCRKGPGTLYYQITYLQQGTAYNVIGRNSLNTWWLVQAPGNITCWMGDPTASQQGPVQQVAIVLVPALPVTPATFTNSSTCSATLHTLGVSLNWSPVSDVTGYRIYRNGTLITTAGPDATAYHDGNAPLKESLVYELEAFNDYGVAARISTNVSSCD